MVGKLGPAWLLAAMCALPFAVSEYEVEVLILFLINVLLAASYRLVTTTGDWSLSHIVLMGVGAYATALMAKLLGWPFWATLPLAGLAAAVIGFCCVYPLLRTKGFGFFIGSFAIGELIRLVWVKFHNPFGGPRGMIGIPSVELGPLDLFDAIPYYFLVLAVVTACLWVMYRIDKAPAIGYVFKAIYMDEALARSVGIRVPRYRAMAFVVGSFFAGIAGALLAHRLGAIDPHNFDVTTMVYLVIWVVVGGVATFWGPLVGVTVMTVVFEMTRPLLEWRPLLFGAILIGFLIFMPGGLESLFPKVETVFRRLRRSVETVARSGFAPSGGVPVSAVNPGKPEGESVPTKTERGTPGG